MPTQPSSLSWSIHQPVFRPLALSGVSAVALAVALLLAWQPGQSLAADAVAERLGWALQKLLLRFESGRCL